MTQVITITPAGTVSGLQVKKGKGFDLKALGRAAIERVSDITWNERAQAWTIKLLEPAPRMYRGVMTRAVIDDAGVTLPDTARLDNISRWSNAPVELVLFDDYDDAVRFEIEFLNSLRVRGVF
jgi:hypothetical protein